MKIPELVRRRLTFLYLAAMETMKLANSQPGARRQAECVLNDYFATVDSALSITSDRSEA